MSSQPSFAIARVPWADARAAALREAMDVEMTALYAHLVEAATPEMNAIVAQALVVHDDDMLVSILALDGERAIAHAAVRKLGAALEVKRVFVDPEYRGRGVSKLIMSAVEDYASDTGVQSLVLQTGNLQVEAIALYRAIGYTEIPAFPPYDVLDVSVCFEKELART